MTHYISRVEFEQRMHSAKLAAEWLDEVMETLVERLAMQILAGNTDFSNNEVALTSSKKFLTLTEDIRNYISWIKDSLLRGAPIDDRLNTGLSLPEKVYGEALRSLAQGLYPVGLTEDASRELHLYLNYLINYLTYDYD